MEEVSDLGPQLGLDELYGSLGGIARHGIAQLL